MSTSSGKATAHPATCQRPLLCGLGARALSSGDAQLCDNLAKQVASLIIALHASPSVASSSIRRKALSTSAARALQSAKTTPGSGIEHARHRCAIVFWQVTERFLLVLVTASHRQFSALANAAGPLLQPERLGFRQTMQFGDVFALGR